MATFHTDDAPRQVCAQAAFTGRSSTSTRPCEGHVRGTGIGPLPCCPKPAAKPPNPTPARSAPDTRAEPKPEQVIHLARLNGLNPRLRVEDLSH